MSNEKDENKNERDTEKEESETLKDELEFLKDTIKNLQEEYESGVDVEYLENDVLESDDLEDDETEKKESPPRTLGIDLGDPEKLREMMGNLGPLTDNLKKMFSKTQDGEEKGKQSIPMGMINNLFKTLGVQQAQQKATVEEEPETIKIKKEEMEDFSDTVAFILKTVGQKERVKIMNVLAERAHFTGELGVQVDVRGEELRKHLEELDRTGLINYSTEESKPHEVTKYGREMINAPTTSRDHEGRTASGGSQPTVCSHQSD